MRGRVIGAVVTIVVVMAGAALWPISAFANGDNLVYNGAKGPVIHKLVVDEIFWLPTGQTFDKVNGDAKYERLMRRFVSDLGGTPYYNIVTQYPDSTKVAPSNSVKLDGWVVDSTNAYPSDVPLNRADVAAEVKRMVSKRGWTLDSNHLFIVFVAKGIRVYKNLDGYHDAFPRRGHPHVLRRHPGRIAITGTSPNGDPQADGEGDILSHEIFEAVTDPAYHFAKAWQDIKGKEISDKCQFAAVDPPRNAEGANIYLHGHPYKIGSRWSNDVSACAPDLCGVSDCGRPLPLSVNGTGAVTADTPIRYSFSTNNPSDTNAATSISVTDTLPAGLTYVAGSSSSPITLSGQTLTWNLSVLAVHDAWTVTFEAAPDISVAGQTVKDCASLTHRDALGLPVLDLIGQECASTSVSSP